jgi:gliding motility-associated-like protein
MKNLVSILIILFIPIFSISQEICNNSIDDDGDGQIDLNDADCSCSGIGGGGSNVTSLIPNSSFEDHTCCPASFSQLNCAVSWQQASGATSDYFNTCGYTGGTGGLNPMPLPLPNGGAGAAGFFSNPGWEENIGTCLNSPMLAGTQYTITLNIAQSMGSPMLDINLYGTPNCGDLPWGGTGCPIGNGSWQSLATQTLILTPNVWTSVTLIFTPSVNINAISIGGPCGGQTGGNNYYFIDDLTMNTSASFAGATITPSGQWCDNNLDLTAATSATGGSWQWYLNGIALVGETGTVINSNTYGIGLYSAVYDDGTNCEQIDYMVNLPPYPTSNFSAINVCENTGVTFTDNSTIPGGSITNWDWDFGGGNTSILQNPSFNFSGSGTFPVSLTTTSDSNCTNTYTASVTVFPEPVADAQIVINGVAYPTDGTQSIEACLYDAIQFNDLSTISSPDNISNFTWDFGDGIQSTLQNPQHLYASAGTYNVTLTVQSNNLCTHVLNFTILINPVPLAGYTTTNVCQYDAAIFTNTSAISSGTINTYDWNFDDASMNSSAINPTHNYGSNGTYNVSLLAISDKGCRDSITQALTIYEVPQANFSVVDSCEYFPAAFTNQSTLSNGTLTNLWDFGDASTDATLNPIHTYSAGIYVAELLVVSNNGCRDSISKNITIYEKPQAGLLFTNECENIAVAFTDNSNVSDGIINFWNWNFGDGSATSNLQSLNHTFTSDGTYNVELIAASNHGCLDTIMQPITIYPEPTTNLTAINACLYNAASFTDNSTIGAPYSISNWSWNFGDGSPVVTTINSTHQYNSDGLYTVTLTTTSTNGCTSNNSTVVEIYPIPVANFTSTEVCVNEPPTLFTSNSSVSNGSIIGWQWNFDGTGTSNLQNPTHNFNSDGIFNVTLLVESNNGCYDSISLPVLVYEKPTANFTSDETRVCDPGQIDFTNLSSSNTTTVDTWQWNFFNGTQTNEQNPTVNYINETDEVIYYNVELIATNSVGCYDTIIINNYIAVVPQPIAAFYPTLGLINTQNTETEFVNQSQLADEYLWDFGDDSETSIEENPTHEYPAIQETYVVELIAYNYNQFCSDTAYSTVIVKDVIIFYVPNIFTPDNDDFNQTWKPIFTSGVDPYDYHMLVYNRWGEVVWESYNYNAAWDGHYGGKLVEDGVYVWKIDFKETMSDKRHQAEGHVTILK